MHDPKLYRYSLFTAFSTLVLIAAGGLVTSTGSGLSVPDWPLSYGKFFPPMIGGIRYEHSHRVIAATVGWLTFILSFWIWRAEKSRHMRALAITASLAILAQAILGGITVKYLLPKPISVSHACLGQTFFTLLCLISLFLSRSWRASAKVTAYLATPFTHLAWTMAGFAYCQLVAGAVVRHTGGKGLIVHFFLAFFIVLHAFFLNQKMFKDPAIQKIFLPHVMLLNLFLAGQLFLGLGAFFYKYMLEKGATPTVPEILFTTAHQTLGAMILATLFVLSFRAHKQLAPDPARPARSEYLELVKVRLTLMALLATFSGFILARTTPIDLSTLLHTLLGAFLIGGGGNALNQYLERAIDQKMRRTHDRPLPSGRLSPAKALIFGIAITAAGLLELYLFVSPRTAFVGAMIFFSYVLIYTPMKRVTPLNTYIGAFPGALPILLGWTAAGGAIRSEVLSLLIFLFIWQLPHFYAIAWEYRKDYKNGGLKMLPDNDPSGKDTAFQLLFFSALLLPASLLPCWIGFSGTLYLAGALLCGSILIILASNLFRRGLSEVRRFIWVTILYLFFIFIFLIADRIWAGFPG